MILWSRKFALWMDPFVFSCISLPLVIRNKIFVLEGNKIILFKALVIICI